MKRQREVRRLLVVFFGLLFLGCGNPKTPRAARGESSSLVGNWVIVEQTTTPLAIIPLCKPIRKGTAVTFTQTAFEVYVDASGRPCDAYAYKTSNNQISFVKEDMLWLCAYELTSNSLKLISTNFFIPDESEKPGIENRRLPVNQPITITLKRK